MAAPAGNTMRKVDGLVRQWRISEHDLAMFMVAHKRQFDAASAGLDANQNLEYGMSSLQRVLVNPETFKESVSAEYSKRPVLGLSHEVLQYIRTTTRVISMDLYAAYHIIERKKEVVDRRTIIKYRNFFESLVVPEGPGMAPPIVHFIWPGAELSFKGVITSLETEYRRFAVDGMPMELAIGISMSEVANGLMESRSVYHTGLGSRAYGDVY